MPEYHIDHHSEFQKPFFDQTRSLEACANESKPKGIELPSAIVIGLITNTTKETNPSKTRVRDPLELETGGPVIFPYSRAMLTTLVVLFQVPCMSITYCSLQAAHPKTEVFVTYFCLMQAQRKNDVTLSIDLLRRCTFRPSVDYVLH
jgi:hypothetical protein